jgi:hypothetical protein
VLAGEVSGQSFGSLQSDAQPQSGPVVSSNVDASNAIKTAKNLLRRFAQFKKALYNSSSLQAVSSVG